MAKDQVINIIETQCDPKDEKKFDQWYSEVHIPMLLKAKGCKGVTRYRVAGETGKPQRFLAVYKFGSQKDLEAFQKCAETAAAIKDFNDNWGSKVKLVASTTCDCIKEW
jgi:uncharacterized protein (TIGR02118 family)